MAGLRGRPRKPKRELKGRALAVRLTPPEWKWVRAQAKADGRKLAEWARRKLLART